MSNLKQVFEQDLAALRATRDELRVQLHLAKADAKDEWNRIEKSWERVERELAVVGEHAKQPLADMEHAMRGLLSEIKQSYARIRAR
jgi:hypothetical protein